MIGTSRFLLPRWHRLALIASAGVVAGLLPARSGVALLLGTGVALAVIIQPVLGLAALTFVVPFGPSGDAGQSLPLTPTDLLVLLVLGASLLAWLTRRQLGPRLTGAFWPGVAFIGVSLLSASAAPDFLVSVKEILRWVELLAMLVVAATFGASARARFLISAALLAALSAESLLGWAQFFLRRGPDSFRIGPFLRAYGTFAQPNPFGGYLAMTLPIAIALAFWRRPWVGRPGGLALLALAATGIGGVALLMSLSRGAWMGVVVGLLALCWLQLRRGGSLILGILAAGLGLVALDFLQVIPPAIAGRLAQIVDYVGLFDASRVVPNAQNWAIVERMAHWQAAWNMYLSHPLLGVGPGHYALAYPDFRVNDLWIYPLGHAHNVYLNVMGELGFLGIATYLIQLIGWGLVILAGHRRATTPLDRALAAGIFASFVAVAIHNIFDDLYVHGLNAQFGLLVGLAAAIQSGQSDAMGSAPGAEALAGTADGGHTRPPRVGSSRSWMLPIRLS